MRIKSVFYAWLCLLFVEMIDCRTLNGNVSLFLYFLRTCHNFNLANSNLLFTEIKIAILQNTEVVDHLRLHVWCYKR